MTKIFERSHYLQAYSFLENVFPFLSSDEIKEKICASVNCERFTWYGLKNRQLAEIVEEIREDLAN